MGERRLQEQQQVLEEIDRLDELERRIQEREQAASALESALADHQQHVLWLEQQLKEQLAGVTLRLDALIGPHSKEQTMVDSHSAASSIISASDDDFTELRDALAKHATSPEQLERHLVQQSQSI